MINHQLLPIQPSTIPPRRWCRLRCKRKRHIRLINTIRHIHKPSIRCIIIETRNHTRFRSVILTRPRIIPYIRARFNTPINTLTLRILNHHTQPRKSNRHIHRTIHRRRIRNHWLLQPLNRKQLHIRHIHLTKTIIIINPPMHHGPRCYTIIPPGEIRPYPTIRNTIKI